MSQIEPAPERDSDSAVQSSLCAIQIPFEIDRPLDWAVQTLTSAEIELPRLEAQLLLAMVMNVSRTAVIAELYPELDSAQRDRFESLVRARTRHVPLAYLRGTQEFYGLRFRVGPATLIPRPETELLVEAILMEDAQRTQRGAPPLRFLDVGTGSGCIAISALANCPQVSAVALDISSEALTLARQNAELNGVSSRLRTVRGDMLEGVGEERFDVIVSNPPYIATDEIQALQPEVSCYEPGLALDGGPDGLIFYRKLAREAARTLRKGGSIYVEVGQSQSQAVGGLLSAGGLTQVGTRPDLAGIERVIYAQKPD